MPSTDKVVMLNIILDVRIERRLKADSQKTRYDYNLTIMKSPKPATDTIYPHIKF
jgi:hypothetical protein